jgi:hypothetical protein
LTMFWEWCKERRKQSRDQTFEASTVLAISKPCPLWAFLHEDVFFI